MKFSILLLTAILTIGLRANAQSPAPEPDTLQIIKQTDPEVKNIPQEGDANYTKGQVKIKATQLPPGVKKSLETDAQYKGWEQGTLYKNKAGNIYTLEITKDDELLMYRFDPSGKPTKD